MYLVGLALFTAKGITLVITRATVWCRSFVTSGNHGNTVLYEIKESRGLSPDSANEPNELIRILK